MADVKITELPSANLVKRGDFFYLVQDDVSKNITAANLFGSVIDPILNGRVIVGSEIQDIYDSNVVSVTKVRTDLYAGNAANTLAIANNLILPKALFLYTANVPYSAAGGKVVIDSPITSYFVVRHQDGKVLLNGNDPENWVNTVNFSKPYGLPKPFAGGIKFIAGSTYIFDVSHPTNTGNIIGISQTFDGTNFLGSEYTANVTRNGTPGTAGANIVFQPRVLPVDTGGVDYLDLPAGGNGQIKIITMKNTSGGSFVITSNVYNGIGLRFTRPGDSTLLQYTGNAWSILASFSSGFSGTTADVPEASSNLYFSNARARLSLSAGDSSILYDANTGTIRANVASIVSGVASIAGKSGNVTLYTTDVPEDPDPLRANTDIGFVYFTNARAEAVLTKSLASLRADVGRGHANVLYVATTGNDLLDGTSIANAVANIHVAISRATPWTSIKIFSGDYTLYNNPVTIPRRVALLGDNQRTVTIRPQNQFTDMFYMNNAVYVWGITFRDHKAPAAVFSYNPNGSAGEIITSPYVQNCASQTTTGVGMRVDGNYVTGLRSMVLDAYTQTNEGGIGVHMLNRGYTQLVSLFTICCNIAVLCENGGFCSLTNSNTSFGTYGLVADGTSPPLYHAKTINRIKGRTFQLSNVSQNFIAVGDAVTFANYNQAKCERDTKLIVDSVAIDVAYNSNTQTTFAGLQYWAQTTSAIPNQAYETVAAINYAANLSARIVQNLDANVFGTPLYQTSTPQYKDATKAVSSISGPIRDLANGYGLVANIIQNGTVGITSNIIPNAYPPRNDTDSINAGNLLINNRLFIQAEVVAFVNATFPAFLATITNGESKCLRDTGYIVDSIYFDLLHGGNRQATMSGVYYYNQSATLSQVVGQKTQTANAFLYLKEITPQIIQAIPLTKTYQAITGRSNPVSQNTTAAAAVVTAGAPEQLRINTLLDRMANIIINGPSAAPPRLPISANAGTLTNRIIGDGFDRTAQLLYNNRDFIAAEVVGYSNMNWANISNGETQFFAVSSATNVINRSAVSEGISPIGFSNLTLDVRTTFIVEANTFVSFHQPSYISASGHTFEYCGAGDTLATALPYAGGVPVQENEVVERRGGSVYYTSTDQVGDFRIGNELLISRATGTINGRTFNKSLFAVMTPYILAIEQG
jgi:hypothetical protein